MSGEMPKVRRRRKYGGRLDGYLIRRLLRREPDEVVRWLKQWNKLGREAQTAMEIQLLKEPTP